MAWVFLGLLKNMLHSISSLMNELQVHLRSTVKSSLIVLDLTLHAYSIQNANFDPKPAIMNLWF